MRQADRNLAFFGHFFGSVRLNILFKPLGYKRHDKNGNKVPEPSADIFGILVKAEIPDVLSCVGQLCAKQANGP